MNVISKSFLFFKKKKFDMIEHELGNCGERESKF